MFYETSSSTGSSSIWTSSKTRRTFTSYVAFPFWNLRPNTDTVLQVMEHHGTSWSTTSAGASPALDSPVPILSTSPTDYSYALASPTLSPSPMNTSFPPRPAPMERRSSCDLFECIEKHSSFTDATAQYIFSQVVEVVHQLDGMGVCHRDLKDENIVVDGEYRVKLIDFGSAVIFDPRVEAPYYRSELLGITPA